MNSGGYHIVNRFESYDFSNNVLHTFVKSGSGSNLDSKYCMIKKPFNSNTTDATKNYV